MGEGTPGVGRKPREVEREIEHLRTRLDRSLAEMDRRRHELIDLKLQVHKHPNLIWGAGAALVLIASAIALAVWRARKREELPAKARRFRIALGRAVDKPHLVARGEAPVWEKVVASVFTAVAASMTKKAIDRAWRTAPAAR